MRDQAKADFLHVFLVPGQAFFAAITYPDAGFYEYFAWKSIYFFLDLIIISILTEKSKKDKLNLLFERSRELPNYLELLDASANQSGGLTRRVKLDSRLHGNDKWSVGYILLTIF